MFEQSLMNTARAKTKWSVLASFFLQTVVLGGAILLSLLSTAPLPARQWLSRVVAPLPKSSRPSSRETPVRVVATRRIEQARLMAPARIPRRVAIIEETEAPIADSIKGAGPGVPGGFDTGPYTGVIGDVIANAAPPPPPAPAAPKPSVRAPVRVGGDVQNAKLIHAPLPEYPPLARQARIAGVVRLTAIIARDGSVDQLSVISGHPLLAPAALAAVSKWRYRPTLLNGEPVEVITQIDVNFTLNR